MARLYVLLALAFLLFMVLTIVNLRRGESTARPLAPIAPAERMIWARGGKTPADEAKHGSKLGLKAPVSSPGAGSRVKASAFFLSPSIRRVGGVGTSPDAEQEQPHDGVAQPLGGPAHPRYDISPQNGCALDTCTDFPPPSASWGAFSGEKKLTNQSRFPSGQRRSGLVLSFLLLFSS